MRNFIILAFIALIGTGCSNLPVKNPVELHNVPNVADTEKEYYIQVGDIVQVRKEPVQPDVDPLEIPVLPDGKIQLPYLTRGVEVAGLTTDQAADKVRRLLRRIERDPIITLNIISFAPRQVYVGGEVQAPAAVPYRGKSMSVLDALFTTGSYTDRSNLEQVIVMRYQGVGTKPLVMALDVTEAITNNDLTQNVALMPEDIIVVPRTRIANANLFVEQYINRMLPLPGVFNSFASAYLVDTVIND